MSGPFSPGRAVPNEGLRDRKRRETRERIAQTALRLFLANGYDTTTLDVIAAEAGISRRTFFSYFKSKDDIVMFWQQASWASMCSDLLKTSPDVPPLDAVRDLMIENLSRYTTEQMTTLDRLVRSSETLLARKQAFYAEQEQAIYAALCEVWRQPQRRTALWMVAVVSVGAMRLTTQRWNDPAGPPRPMAEFLRDAFDSVKAELC
jgi:AcrR family transcriptional regulator